MFPTEFVAELCINYEYNGEFVNDIHGQLFVSENKYQIIFRISDESSMKLTKGVPKFMYKSFKRNFHVKKCTLNNHLLRVSFENSKIIHLKTSRQLNESYVEWTMSVDCLTIQKEKEDNSTGSYVKIYLLNYGEELVSELPLSDFSQALLNNTRDEHELRFRGSLVRIGLDNVSKKPFIKISPFQDNVLMEFLCLLSFYYMLPIKHWIIVKHNGGFMDYHYLSPFVTFEGVTNNLKEWDYYKKMDETCLSLDYLIDAANTFVEQSTIPQINQVFKALFNFVDIQNDSEQSQFIFLVNILSTLAEKLHHFNGDTTSIIKKLFKLHNVSFPKIDDELKKQHFKKTKVVVKRCLLSKIFSRKKPTKFNDNIDTFVDLRNELTHGLPTREMLDYLHNYLILPRLKMGVFLILLSELGIKDIKYVFFSDSLKVHKS